MRCHTLWVGLNNGSTVITYRYQSLPKYLLALRNRLVILVWSAGGLPILTGFVHVIRALVRRFWFGGAGLYQLLPTVTCPPI